MNLCRGSPRNTIQTPPLRRLLMSGRSEQQRSWSCFQRVRRQPARRLPTAPECRISNQGGRRGKSNFLCEVPSLRQVFSHAQSIDLPVVKNPISDGFGFKFFTDDDLNLKEPRVR